jgi:hypothetical protein
MLKLNHPHTKKMRIDNDEPNMDIELLELSMNPHPMYTPDYSLTAIPPNPLSSSEGDGVYEELIPEGAVHASEGAVIPHDDIMLNSEGVDNRNGDPPVVLPEGDNSDAPNSERTYSDFFDWAISHGVENPVNPIINRVSHRITLISSLQQHPFQRVNSNHTRHTIRMIRATPRDHNIRPSHVRRPSCWRSGSIYWYINSLINTVQAWGQEGYRNDPERDYTLNNFETLFEIDAFHHMVDRVMSIDSEARSLLISADDNSLVSEIYGMFTILVPNPATIRGFIADTRNMSWKRSDHPSLGKCHIPYSQLCHCLTACIDYIMGL